MQGIFGGALGGDLDSILNRLNKSQFDYQNVTFELPQHNSGQVSEVVTALVMVSELFSLLVVPVLAPYLGPVHVASLYSSEHDLPPDLDMTA